MKKHALLLLVIGLFTATVSAQTTISYFSFTTGSDHIDELEAIIAAFEQENPGITIDYTTAPFDAYFTRLQTDFAAGNPPDVFELNYENFVTFASRGTLMPMAELLEGNPAGTFYPAALEAFSYDGVQYGLPITFSTVVLFYNKDLFDAAGVAYPSDEWTWDDVIAAAQALNDPESRVWGIYQPVQFWEFYKAAAQAGGGLEVGDTVAIDTPENREALHYLIDKIHEHGVMPSDAEMSGVANEDMFAGGQLAMLVSGIWMFDRFSAAPFDWDIVVEPGNVQKATHFFSNAAVIAANADHPEAAARWVEFLAAHPVTVETRIASSWELPALSLERSALLEPYLAQPMPENRQAVFASLEYAVTPPVVENQPQLQDLINQELEAARLGTKSVEQALADAQRRVEALVSQ
jgi:multiple sugar transport system substrate-binding protein